MKRQPRQMELKSNEGTQPMAKVDRLSRAARTSVYAKFGHEEGMTRPSNFDQEVKIPNGQRRVSPDRHEVDSGGRTVQTTKHGHKRTEDTLFTKQKGVRSIDNVIT